MIDLGAILALATLLKDCIRENQAFDEKVFLNHITPIWDQFRTIHEDYKSSFRKYIVMASNEKFRADAMVEEIARDSLFSRDLRTHLVHLIDSIPKDEFQRKEICELYEFLDSISAYFEYHNRVDWKNIKYANNTIKPPIFTLENWDTYDDEMTNFRIFLLSCNVARMELIHHFYSAGKLNSQIAKAILEGMIADLQYKYDRISETYCKIKMLYID